MSSASVTVDNRTVGAIDHGLLVFVGVQKDDGPADAQYIVGKMKVSLVNDGPVTLLLDSRKTF